MNSWLTVSDLRALDERERIMDEQQRNTEEQRQIMSDKELKEGMPVMKYTGDYWWTGIVCSVFFTPDNMKRVVVAHEVDMGYVLHIYSPTQLKII